MKLNTILDNLDKINELKKEIGESTDTLQFNVYDGYTIYAETKEDFYNEIQYQCNFNGTANHSIGYDEMKKDLDNVEFEEDDKSFEYCGLKFNIIGFLR